MWWWLIPLMVLGYIVIGGFVFSKEKDAHEKSCKRCQSPHNYNYCDSIVPELVAIFWPLTIPLILGVWLGAREKQPRHQKALKKIEALEQEAGIS